MSINAQPGRVIFSGNNIATTVMVYGGANALGIIGSKGGGSVAATTGWIDSKYDHAVVQLGVATEIRADNNIVFRIEGKYAGLGRPASILATLFSGVESKDRVINVVGKMSQLRVGVKTTVGPASPNASPCNVYAGIVFSDVK